MLSKLRAVLFWGGIGCLLITMIAFVGTAIYEWIIPPTDMHLPGLITAVLMFYVAPSGVVLLVLRGLLRITSLLCRAVRTVQTSPDKRKDL